MGNWNFTDVDKRIADEVSSFLPERVFDAHAHLYTIEHVAPSPSGFFTEGPPVVSIPTWREYLGKQLVGMRFEGGLFIGLPQAGCDLQAPNDFVVSQLVVSAGTRCRVSIRQGFPENCEARRRRSNTMTWTLSARFWRITKKTWLRW